MEIVYVFGDKIEITRRMFLLKRFNCEANSFKGSSGMWVCNYNFRPKYTDSFLVKRKTQVTNFLLHLKADLRERNIYILL